MAALFTLLLLLLLTTTTTTTQVSSSCTSEEEEGGSSKSGHHLTELKLTAIVAILIAGTTGVSIPILGRRVRFLTTEMFFLVKAFAGGVILATGFVHILPDAFNSLSSPCLPPSSPWKHFPFAGLVAMCSAIATMLVDSIAAGVYGRHQKSSSKVVMRVNDAEIERRDIDHPPPPPPPPPGLHVHSHAHASSSSSSSSESEIFRKRVVSKVLELGIVAHSVVIGVSLGASESPGTIRPLLVALCFHQFFEGVGLGGCISQAKFEERSVAVMAAFFSVTTPAGVGVGIGVSKVYNENGVVATIVEGMLNSASAGILIYMALVDLLAADFMAEKVKSDIRIQVGGYLSLFLGVACMSALAIWA